MTPTRATATDTSVGQGDVFSDVEYLMSYVEEGEEATVTKVVFPFVIVLTQECDLKWDFACRRSEGEQANQMLMSILVAPLYNAEHLKLGDHLTELTVKSRSFSTKEWKLVTSNRDPRYHHLEGQPNLKPMVIDFKHYFSVRQEYLEQIRSDSFVTYLKPFHREAVAHRFAAYLSRIAIPSEDHRPIIDDDMGISLSIANTVDAPDKGTGKGT